MNTRKRAGDKFGPTPFLIRKARHHRMSIFHSTKSRKTGAILAAAVATATILAGCTSTAEEVSSDEAPSFGEISLQYSWIKNEEFAGEFYAEENGYYTEAGFDKVYGISGPSTGVPVLLSNTVQVALSDTASVGAAIAEQDAPLKIIGATFQKNPFTILSLADGGNIQTPEDLIGKRIGVQDSNASVFAALLNANGISIDQLTVVPVEFDPTPLTNGEVDGFMAYLTNESVTVEMSGYEVTNLSYAENGVPYVAETFTVTDQFLAENRELLKAFLIAEIKGWTDVFQESTDDTVSLITKYYDQATADGDLTFGPLDPIKTAAALEAQLLLISTDETLENGLFTISDALKAESIASLEAAGWNVTAEQLFDTSIIDEIYAEFPELKDYS
jgi:ABC-type nitrate/sulfonate/bicarbonate transport system substrate-binding protein